MKREKEFILFKSIKFNLIIETSVRSTSLRKSSSLCQESTTMPFFRYPVVNRDLAYFILAVSGSFFFPLILTTFLTKQTSSNGSIDQFLQDSHKTYSFLGRLLAEITYFLEVHGSGLLDKIMEVISFFHTLLVDIRSLFALLVMGVLYGFYNHYRETKETFSDALRPIPSAIAAIWDDFKNSSKVLFNSLISREFVQFLVTLVIIFTLRDVITEVVAGRSKYHHVN